MAVAPRVWAIGPVTAAALNTGANDPLAALQAYSTPSAWVAIPAAGSWIWNTPIPAARIEGDFVHLEGVFSGSTPTGAAVGYLPVGYRPVRAWSGIYAIGNTAGASGKITVNVNGDILAQINAGTPNAVSLSNIYLPLV